MQYRMSRMVAGPFLRLLARPSVIGAEHIPSSGAAILASNHLSVVDSIYLPLMVERPVSFAAKSEYFTGTGLRDRVVGAYLRSTNQLRPTGPAAQAAMAMLDAALDLLKSGQLFGIYPEGTRSPDGRLYRGRTGVGYLALNSGAPVIPVAMVGTEHILPPGRRIPTARQDRDQDRRAARLRRVPRSASRGTAAAGGHRRGRAGHPEAVRAGVRADVRLGPQGGTGCHQGRSDVGLTFRSNYSASSAAR